MSIKYLTIIVSAAFLISFNAAAEDNMEFGLEDIPAEQSESAQNKQAEQTSTYIEQLKLTAEQLDQAKYISDSGRLKQEQILKSISLLRQQARDLETQNLNEFEKILTPEQKEIFRKLRAEEMQKRQKAPQLPFLAEENTPKQP